MVASPSLFVEGCDLPLTTDDGKTAERRAREVALVRTHLPAVWRFLRRLGLSSEDADDAAQEVFLIAVKKLDSIQKDQDKRFLFGIALRVASRYRRSLRARAKKTVPVIDDKDFESTELGSDELLERKEAREFLDQTLGEMPAPLRTAFALFEFEEMTMNEIAEVTGAPVGTVASRIRRAREQFQEAAKRIQSTIQARLR